MKKVTMKLANAKNFADVKRRLTNAFSEKGAEAASALRDLIDELEASDVEYDVDEFKAAVEELIANYGDVPEAVAEAIAKKVQTLQDSMAKADPKGKLTNAVKNQISAAILKAASKDDVKDAVEKVLTKNGITGLQFGESVDFAISDAWGNSNELFSQLYKTPVTKFFYTEQTLKDKAILAKQWKKGNATDKVIQELTAKGKSISPDYIYKRQQMARIDLDKIEQAGNTTNFLTWLMDELDRQIVNTIVMHLLVGDTTNDANDRITTWESIGAKKVSDVFTTVVNPATPGKIALTDLRKMCDSVINLYGNKKVVVLSQTLLSQVSEFVYAAGGSTMYRTREEIAGMLGVDQVIVSSVLDPADSTTADAVCLIPNGYWWNEMNSLEVTYPEYSKNSVSYLKERNCGGAIHDLYSTAVLRAAE